MQSSELFTWLCVFVLIWQGGGGLNLKFSLMTTFVLFVAYALLKGDILSSSTCTHEHITVAT